jgi:hypothetical protein
MSLAQQFKTGSVSFAFDFHDTKTVNKKREEERIVTDSLLGQETSENNQKKKKKKKKGTEKVAGKTTVTSSTSGFEEKDYSSVITPPSPSLVPVPCSLSDDSAQQTLVIESLHTKEPQKVQKKKKKTSNTASKPVMASAPPPAPPAAAPKKKSNLPPSTATAAAVAAAAAPSRGKKTPVSKTSSRVAKPSHSPQSQAISSGVTPSVSAVSSSGGPSVLSSRDPELTEEERIKRKYGTGVNLSTALSGSTKRSIRMWAPPPPGFEDLNPPPAESGVSERVERRSSNTGALNEQFESLSLAPPPAGAVAAPAPASSTWGPFSFGFSL